MITIVIYIINFNKPIFLSIPAVLISSISILLSKIIATTLSKFLLISKKLSKHP